MLNLIAQRNVAISVARRMMVKVSNLALRRTGLFELLFLEEYITDLEATVTDLGAWDQVVARNRDRREKRALKSA